MIRVIRVAAALGIATLSVAATAHVTVSPKESAVGAHVKYVVRVPNEKQVDTVAIEIRFPSALRVRSFEQRPDWMTEPIRDASGTLIGVRWRGSLPPQQFAEFGLLAVNPAAAGDLAWSAIQSFADGTKVEWSGAAGSKTPAPRVTIK